MLTESYEKMSTSQSSNEESLPKFCQLRINEFEGSKYKPSIKSKFEGDVDHQVNETNFVDTEDSIELIDYNFRKNNDERYRGSHSNIFDSVCKYGDVKQVKKDTK